MAKKNIQKKTLMLITANVHGMTEIGGNSCAELELYIGGTGGAALRSPVRAVCMVCVMITTRNRSKYKE
jgi:hypothetical protein